MPTNIIGEIGQLGLIVFDGTGYFFIKEDDWLALESTDEERAESGDFVALFNEGEELFINVDLVGPAPTNPDIV